MELAAYDASDGYISDVPRTHDYAQSDVSHDFVESSRTLERNFQDKYKMLRQAYEDRILKLTNVIEETCSKLFNDELLNELKNDKTSAAFIPAHLSEIISNQLQSENERHLHTLFEKLGVVEVEKIAYQKSIVDLKKQLVTVEKELAESKRTGAACVPLTQNIHNLEKNFREYVESSTEEIAVLQATIEQMQARDKKLSNKLEIVMFELAEKNKLCETFKVQLNAKTRDIDTLEHSFEQSSRELAMIEGMEKQEQLLKKEMKEQIRTLTQQRQALNDDNQQLRVKLQYASDELDRCHLIAQQKEADDVINKQKITDLMAQVESMLTQEADESNSAIATVHEKMKLFRQRMSAEISREKRLNSALQEELAASKKTRSESLSEQQRLQEQVNLLREQVEKEHHDVQVLQRQLHTETEQVVSLRVHLAEAQAQCTRSDHIMSEYERLKHAEVTLLEQRAELKFDKDKAFENSHLEKRLEASRVHYENELAELRKQLKNAYSFDKSGKSAEPTSEVSYKTTIQSWVQENARLKQRHTAELSSLASQLRSEYEAVVQQLQARLEEAANNLDKLKGMVRDGKSVIRTQSSQLEALRTEVRVLKQYQGVDQPFNVSRNTSRVSAASTSLAAAAAAATSSPARRSSLGATPQLSPTQTADAVRGHRNAIALRSSSAPRTSAATSSPTPSVAQVKGQIAARRSSTSVIGATSGSVFPFQTGMVDRSQSHFVPTPPVSARSGAGGEDLEEVRSLQLVAQQAQNEVMVLKEQVDQLLEEAQRNKATIRDLESAKSRLTAQAQMNKEQQGVQEAGVPWEASFNSSLLQAKIDEINDLRGELSSLKAQNAEETKRLKGTIESLQSEVDNLRSQNTNLSMTNAQLGREIDQKMDGGTSTILSEESFHSSTSHHRHRQTHTDVTQQEFVLDTSAHARQLEQSLQHQSDLAEISAAELCEERSRVKEMRKREVKLFQLLADVQKQYQSQIHLLRQDLMNIKASVQTIAPYTQLEVRKTVGGLSNKLNAIFAHFHRKQEHELKTARIELSLAHTEEINALESRFTRQIESQAAEHTLELEQLHGELVRKAEDALGFNAYIDSVAVPVDEDDIEEDELNTSSASVSSHARRSVSFARDTDTSSSRSGVNDRSYSSVGSKQRRASASASFSSSAAAAAPTPSRRQSGASAFSSKLNPAFESVLSGLIEALQAEDMLDTAGSQQLVSLAKAHQEPSFAAQAAAKSLLSNHLEKFVNDLLARSLSRLSGKSAGAGSGASAESMSSSTTASKTSSLQGYSTVDYALFFDS